MEQKISHDAVSEDGQGSVNQVGPFRRSLLSSNEVQLASDWGHVMRPGCLERRAQAWAGLGGNQLPVRRSWTPGGAWAVSTWIPGPAVTGRGVLARVLGLVSGSRVWRAAARGALGGGGSR